MSTAVAESTGMSVDQLIKRINGCKEKWEEIESSRLAIALEIGQACNELKAQCKLEGTKWGPVRDTLTFHQTTICDYMRLAKYWDECELDDAEDISTVDRALDAIYQHQMKNNPAAALTGMEAADDDEPEEQDSFKLLDQEDEEEQTPVEDSSESSGDTTNTGSSSKETKKEKPKPAHVEMVQLFFNQTTKPVWDAWVKILNWEYGTKNQTDAVWECLKREVERIHSRGDVTKEQATEVAQLADKIAEGSEAKK